MKKSQEIIVSHSDAGCRLDAFLATKLAQYSRSQIAKMIKDKEVLINDERSKPSHILKGDELVLMIEVKKSVAIGLVAQDIPLDIIYRDDHIAIINKAQGLTVHPGAGIFDHTLCNALLHHFPDMQVSDQSRPGLVHRLDRHTSGAMVIALSHQAHRVLSDAFKNREVKKIYSAVCHGEIAKDAFELKTGHARHPYNRLKFFTGLAVPRMPSSDVRMAHTSIEVLSRRYGMTRVRATLHTGRTHQIRAHLADIGHPLVGDALYGGDRALKKSAPPDVARAVEDLIGQSLHAESLSFAHPITGDHMQFSAKPPPSLARLVELFDVG